VTGDTEGDIRALEPKINNPSHTSARITGLKPSHNYRFFVWARTSAGQGDQKSVQVLTKGNVQVLTKGNDQVVTKGNAQVLTFKR
jgi:hypothetical protein